MPNFGCGSDLLVALSRFTFWWWLTQGRKNQVMIRKGIMAGIYEAVPGRGSREQWGRYRGASLSQNWGPRRPGGKNQGHSQKSEELRASRTKANTTSYPGALCLPREEECDCPILSCSLSPSCRSPWVRSDLGFQIWGWGPPVPTSMEAVSSWGRGWSTQSQW